MVRSRGLISIFVAACALAVLATAAPAGAATTRAEYATQVNTVCESAQQEAEQIVDKYFNLFPDSGGNKINVKKVMRVWRNLYRDIMALDQRTIDGITAVTAAPGDEALVASWIASLQRAHDLTFPAIRRALAALRFVYKADRTGEGDLSKGERRKFKGLLRKLNKANRPVNAEIKKADAVALQLGATQCTDESANELSARAILPPSG
jgi:hypothetical protein